MISWTSWHLDQARALNRLAQPHTRYHVRPPRGACGGTAQYRATSQHHDDDACGHTRRAAAQTVHSSPLRCTHTGIDAYRNDVLVSVTLSASCCIWSARRTSTRAACSPVHGRRPDIGTEAKSVYVVASSWLLAIHCWSLPLSAAGAASKRSAFTRRGAGL